MNERRKKYVHSYLKRFLGSIPRCFNLSVVCWASQDYNIFLTLTMIDLVQSISENEDFFETERSDRKDTPRKKIDSLNQPAEWEIFFHTTLEPEIVFLIIYSSPNLEHRAEVFGSHKIDTFIPFLTRGSLSKSGLVRFLPLSIHSEQRSQIDVLRFQSTTFYYL